MHSADWHKNLRWTGSLDPTYSMREDPHNPEICATGRGPSASSPFGAPDHHWTSDGANGSFDWWLAASRCFAWSQMFHVKHVSQHFLPRRLSRAPLLVNREMPPWAPGNHSGHGNTVGDFLSASGVIGSFTDPRVSRRDRSANVDTGECVCKQYERFRAVPSDRLCLPQRYLVRSCRGPSLMGSGCFGHAPKNSLHHMSSPSANSSGVDPSPSAAAQLGGGMFY